VGQPLTEADHGGSDRRLYQSSPVRGFAVYLIVIFALVVVAGIAYLSPAVVKHPTRATSIVGACFIVGGVIGIGWAALLMRRSGVLSTRQGIEVRNWLRTRRIPWSDIEGFAFGDAIADLTLRESLASPSLQTYVAPSLQTYVTLRDGRHHPMTGLTATPLADSRSAVRQLLIELDEDRKSHLGIF
jgi:hypothetical protein